jgi:aminopeptidase
VDLIERYAALALQVGINLQPGQDLLIEAAPEHMAMARALATEAYRSGARRVSVTYDDQHIRKAAVLHGPMEALTTAFEFEFARYREFADGGAMIYVVGNPDPHLFDGLDPARVAATPVPLWKTLQGVTARIPWLVIAMPTAGWAEEVFGEPDVERLWDAVATANRLDTPDPVAAWHSHIAMLHARREALDDLAPAAIRFRGEGTDLTLPMLPGARWLAATDHTPDGHEFNPNLPTEEVYGTPHLGRGDGVVRATAPLPLAGSTVHGLVIRIEAGRIVEVQADSGVELVRAQLERDAQAPYLGEVAIVDGSSRVAQLGLTFHNTLYDENAGCHIAFGMAYPSTIPSGPAMTDEEKLAAGLNVSSVHTDVVIGGPEVDVDALDADGHVTPILRHNTWQLPLA